MKTFLNFGYSNGIFWRCVGNPTDAPGQSCTKILTFEVAGFGLVYLPGNSDRRHLDAPTPAYLNR
jgi:hypothetical protein